MPVDQVGRDRRPGDRAEIAQPEASVKRKHHKRSQPDRRRDNAESWRSSQVTVRPFRGVGVFVGGRDQIETRDEFRRRCLPPFQPTAKFFEAANESEIVHSFLDRPCREPGSLRRHSKGVELRRRYFRRRLLRVPVPTVEPVPKFDGSLDRQVRPLNIARNSLNQFQDDPPTNSRGTPFPRFKFHLRSKKYRQRKQNERPQNVRKGVSSNVHGTNRTIAAGGVSLIPGTTRQ
uniref:Uncharacterized protein n=1 Tax=uncultured marine virus TaxID=186617 RepID=A0A0F7L705_9VIRU|nr:hypothetical protein [uncultured marine virus]